MTIQVLPIPPGTPDDDAMLTGLMQELAVVLQAADSCHHVCRPLGLARQGDALLIVMRGGGGDSLTSFVRKQLGGKLTLVPALAVLRDLARGVQELHARRVWDLDLNPGSILITTTGSAVISDLSLGRIVTQWTKMPAALSPGAPVLVNYQPPEKYEESGCTGPSCDIWSLVCVLIHMLTGQAPMAGLTAQQIMFKVRLWTGVAQECPGFCLLCKPECQASGVLA